MCNHPIILLPAEIEKLIAQFTQIGQKNKLQLLSADYSLQIPLLLYPQLVSCSVNALNSQSETPANCNLFISLTYLAT